MQDRARQRPVQAPAFPIVIIFPLNHMSGCIVYLHLGRGGIDALLVVASDKPS